ncbi:MAG: hypothetical protein RIC95_04150 [Vicingaceae bacterium]
MKTLLSFLFLTFSIAVNAQISITTNDMPQAGDTFRYSIGTLDTAVLLGFQSTGPNQQWNFNSLQAQRQNVEQYFASANTPYSAQVSNRIGLKIADTLALGGLVNLYDVYDFFDNSTAEYAKDYRAASVPTGLSFPFPPVLTIAPAFTDKDEVYQFPLNYLDRDSSTFDFAYNNSLIGAYYGSNGYRINEVEAWGTMVTPYGTFNTLKVKTDVVSYDTVSFGGNNFGFNSHTREYKWLSNQMQFPVVTVSGNVVAGVFIPTNVQYRDSVRNVPSLFAPLALFNADTTAIEVNDTVFFNNTSISISPIQNNWSISPSTYQYVNGTSATSQNPVVVFTDTGSYDVQLIVQNNQGVDTLDRADYIDVNPINTGINNTKLPKFNFKLFPNPMKQGSLLMLQFDKNIKPDHFVIYTLEGKAMLEQQTQAEVEQLMLPTQSLLSGTYVLGLFKNGERIANQKFIIR